jgi:hypothetical protein
MRCESVIVEPESALKPIVGKAAVNLTVSAAKTRH